MPCRSRAARAGFTLIELMMVVAITGILSVLAAYGVRKYVANSKTAEARNGLGRIANAAVLAYEHENMAGTVMQQGTTSALSRSLCKSASKSVPSSEKSIRGAKYESTYDDWAVDAVGNSGFACLHFTIDQPQYYMYSYLVSGSEHPGDSFVATANGDLNGDGLLSTYQLVGSINSAYAINIAPGFLEVLPDE